MKHLSARAFSVKASTTLAIDSLYKQMKADGVDVIGFGAGEPDFATPEFIKQAGIEAIQADFTKYTPAAGIPDLRKAVCERLRQDLKLEYKPSEIVIASGAKHVVYVALQTITDPGDEIILPAPYWVSYIEMIRLANGVPVVVTATEEENFKLTPAKLEAAITPKTKAVILNNPSNPTGMVYTREELAGLAAVCLKHDIYIVADEIYCNLVYDGAPFTSIATLGYDVKAHTILINGVSKSYAMTGWRVGYAAAEENIIKAMSNYLSHSTGAPASFSQKAAVAALAGPQEEVEAMQKAFEERRNYLVERMNKIPGISCLKPEGAFYVMMNMSQWMWKTVHDVTIDSAETFASVFLKEGLVATVPCTGFGAPGFIRWSYATSLENIKEGLDRLEKFLSE